MLIIIHIVSASALFSASLCLYFPPGCSISWRLGGVGASIILCGTLLFHQGGLGLLFTLFYLWKNLAMDTPCWPSLFIFAILLCFSWILGPSFYYAPPPPHPPFLEECLEVYRLFSCNSVLV